MVAASLLLAATSCSNEEELIPSGNDGTEVSFTVGVNEGGVSSRSINDGTTAKYLVVGVYDRYGNELSQLRSYATFAPNAANQQEATVRFKLVTDQTYSFIFWAQSENPQTKANGTYYDVTDLTDIEVKYDGVDANLEARDAFYQIREDLRVSYSSMKENITLVRPFAQLNVGTTKNDAQAAGKANFDLDNLKSKVTIKGLADSFQPFTGIATGNKNVDFTLATIPDDDTEELDITENGNTSYYEYLSMNYLLVPGQKDDDKKIYKADFEFHSSSSGTDPIKLSVDNVPLRRNYRTNIIGDILTEQVVFTIKIDNKFHKPDYLVKTHTVSTFDELKEAAKENAKIWLSNDITLTSALTFDHIVTIDGNGHSLKGKPLTFKGSGVTLKNVKFDSPATNGKASAVYVYDGNKTFTVDGCTFANAEYEAIQYLSDDVENVTIQNCTFSTAQEVARHIHLELRDANGYYESTSAKAVIKDNKFYNVDKCAKGNDKDFVCISGFMHANMTISGNQVYDIPTADLTTWQSGGDYIWISDGKNHTSLFTVLDEHFCKGQ